MLMIAGKLSRAERRLVRRWENEKEEAVERVALTPAGKMVRVGCEWYSLAAIKADLKGAAA